MWARVRVVVKAAPTWLVLASTVVTIVADELATVLPESREALAAFVARVVAWIGAAVAIIRRVTPVLPDERGVLPPS